MVDKRRPGSCTVSISMPIVVRDMLNIEAGKKDMSISEFIRTAILNYIKEKEDAPKIDREYAAFIQHAREKINDLEAELRYLEEISREG